MSVTHIPYRLVPAEPPGRVATLPMLDVVEDPWAGDVCTSTDGDRHGRLCRCHWAPWLDRDGFADHDYMPPRFGETAPFDWLGPTTPESEARHG